MTGIAIKAPARKYLVAAIAIASGGTASSLVSAGTYTAILSGAIEHETTEIFDLFGFPEDPFPPEIQSPRLVPFGGPGWAAELQLSIDSNTGAPTNFELTTTAGYTRGSASTAGMYPPGQRWLAGSEFPTTDCGVSSTNPGETGTIVYSCPLPEPWLYLPELSTAETPGYQCLTVLPSSTQFSGSNGCGSHNAGITFPGGVPNFQTPQTTNGAHIAVAANSSYSLSGTNSAYYASNDPTQIFNGVEIQNFYGSNSAGVVGITQGVDFTIKHTGSFSNNNFVITEVTFVNRSTGYFPCGSCAPHPWFKTSQHSFFDQPESQTFQLSNQELGKSVPATGTFGIFATLAGLIGIAIRMLRKKMGITPNNKN